MPASCCCCYCCYCCCYCYRCCCCKIGITNTAKVPLFLMTACWAAGWCCYKERAWKGKLFPSWAVPSCPYLSPSLPYLSPSLPHMSPYYTGDQQTNIHPISAKQTIQSQSQKYELDDDQLAYIREMFHLSFGHNCTLCLLTCLVL